MERAPISFRAAREDPFALSKQLFVRHLRDNKGWKLSVLLYPRIDAFVLEPLLARLLGERREDRFVALSRKLRRWKERRVTLHVRKCRDFAARRRVHLARRERSLSSCTYEALKDLVSRRRKGLFALVSESNRTACVHMPSSNQIFDLDGLLFRMSSSRRVGPVSMDPSRRNVARRLGTENLPRAKECFSISSHEHFSFRTFGVGSQPRLVSSLSKFE